MMRWLVLLLAPLASACATKGPVAIRYDLESTPTHFDSPSGFNVTIAVPPISAPSWLRTTALVYRLDYEIPSPPRAYTQSQWIAPPSELLTLRLRERVAAVNRGFTLALLPKDTDGYRLDVTLEQFAQVFPAPHQSQCIVALSATLVEYGERIVAQKTFRSEGAAPSEDAAGAVEGLVAASAADIEQMLTWLGRALPTSFVAKSEDR